jgi:hypothetical protein
LIGSIPPSFETHQTLRGEVVGAVLAVLLVASLGAGYFIGTGYHSVTTSTATSIGTTTLFNTYTLASILTTTFTLGHTVYTTTTTVDTATSTTVYGSPVPLSSVQTADVTVGGSPNTIAVNPSTDRIYVVGGSTSLVVIDALSHAVIARVTLPASSNSGVAVDTNSNMVYVAVQGGVVVIDGSTNTIVKEFPIGFGYRSIAFDSSTHILYGSEEMVPYDLLGVDGRTGAIVANISLGYWANDIIVNPSINMIYAVGCNGFGLVCGSEVSVINGTSKTVVNQVALGSDYYATATIDPRAGFVYVSGNSRLVELDRLGSMVYDSYPETCGPFVGMSVDSSLSQVLLAPQNYPYLLAYDREYGNLVNMYSLPSAPQYVAYNSNTNETYVIVSESLLAFHDVASTGHLNATLIGSDQNCLPV